MHHHRNSGSQYFILTFDRALAEKARRCADTHSKGAFVVLSINKSLINPGMYKGNNDCQAGRGPVMMESKQTRVDKQTVVVAVSGEERIGHVGFGVSIRAAAEHAEKTG